MSNKHFKTGDIIIDNNNIIIITSDNTYSLFGNNTETFDILNISGTFNGHRLDIKTSKDIFLYQQPSKLTPK